MGLDYPVRGRLPDGCYFDDAPKPMVVYDVGDLFAGDGPAAPTDEAWRGFLQTGMAGWSVAEAAAIRLR